MCLCEGSDVFFVFSRRGMPCVPKANSEDETLTPTHYTACSWWQCCCQNTLTHTQTLPLQPSLSTCITHTHVCGVLTCLHQHTLCTACVFRTLTDKEERGRHTTPLHTYTIINDDRIDFSSKYIHKQYNTFWTNNKHPFVKQNCGYCQQIFIFL